MHSAPRISAFLLASALVATAILHTYWVLGGKWGLAAALGGPAASIPSAPLVWAVIVLLVVGAAGVLARVGVWGEVLPRFVCEIGAWLLFVLLLGATVLNASTGRFAEVAVIAPLCGLLAGLSFIVARSPRRASASGSRSP